MSGRVPVRFSKHGKQMMKRLLTLLVAFCCGVSVSWARPAEVLIVPRPVSVEMTSGEFRFSEKTPVVATDARLKGVAGIFSQAVSGVLGGELPVVTTPQKRAVTLSLKEGFAPEEYRLEVKKSGVVLTASTPQAILHGLRTLQQLVVAGVRVPACVVCDKPVLQYRGAMLDVVRHFFTVEEVKRYIDILSLHKINKFHWHLTDDQGWRIEIKKYPRLTEVGSRRAESMVGGYDRHHPERNVYDGKPYGGIYTQEEIREVVRYAAERFIDVIPEIEMPGHGLAALTAYPWLGCTGRDYAVWTHWGISEDVYCAGKESSFEFLEDVLSEVIALFPYEYVHIGGDECPKARWKECPLCQERIREQGLKDEYELQSYFVCRVEDWVRRHGRKIIGWDEILQGGVSKTATVMAWNGTDIGIKAARGGNHVIMTPKWYCYFDYSQTSNPRKYEPYCGERYLSVEQVYRLDPYDKLRVHERENILGVQCNMWTEYVSTFSHLQHMVLPRMAALSEVGWACDRKNYPDFLRRLPAMVAVYDAEGYRYAKYLFEGIN